MARSLQEQTIVVTAQNGIDKATYTVKKDIPQKTVAGIRQGINVSYLLPYIIYGY